MALPNNMSPEEMLAHNERGRCVAEYFNNLETTLRNQQRTMDQMQEAMRSMELAIGWFVAHWPVVGQIKTGFPYTPCANACEFCRAQTPMYPTRMNFAYGGQVVIHQFVPIIDPNGYHAPGNANQPVPAAAPVAPVVAAAAQAAGENNANNNNELIDHSRAPTPPSYMAGSGPSNGGPAGGSGENAEAESTTN